MKSTPTKEQLKILKKNMDQLSPIASEEWDKFSQLWTCIKIPKRKTITRAGEIEPYMYFVLGGLQRIYHLAEDGKEATIIFSYPYSFSGVVDSAMTQTPANYFFETLSESILLRAPIDKFLELTKAHVSIGAFVNLALSYNIKGLLHRLVEIQSLKAEEKFRLFMKRSPHMLQIVPHRYLANYLGIDPTNFSKFINKIII